MNSSFGDENKVDESNPFSFKNFQIPINSDIPAFDLPDVKTSEESSSQANPFSFNKFIPNENPLDFSLPDVSISLPQPDSIIGLPELNNPSIDEIPTEFELYDDNNFPLVTKNEETLKEELKQSQEIIIKQQNKILKLEKRLRELEKKEENEAKTLELLVQQVEKNLEITTARAVESDRTVEMLKQELSQMKNQITLLKNENLTLKNQALNRNLFFSINKIAGELNTAALTAEKSLSFLGQGVETLKLIASNLESLEKIGELDD